jgi:hypothetical protein
MKKEEWKEDVSDALQGINEIELAGTEGTRV